MSDVIEKTLSSVADYAAKTEAKESIERVLSDNEQEIVAMVLDIQQNDFVQKIADQWDKMSPEDQKDLYEKGSQTVRGTIKRAAGSSLIPQSPINQLFSFFSAKKSLAKGIFDRFTPAVRIFVHLGILRRPDGLSDEEIHKNIEDDREGLENQLAIAQAACTVIPQLRPGLAIIQRIKPLVKIGAESQEKILHAVNNAMEKDHIIAGAKSHLYKNVSTDTTNLGTQVEAGNLSYEVKQAA